MGEGWNWNPWTWINQQAEEINRRRLEAERLRQEEEERLRREEEERKRREEEERRRREEEERKRQEEERLRQEEAERQRIAEEERKRQEELAAHGEDFGWEIEGEAQRNTPGMGDLRQLEEKMARDAEPSGADFRLLDEQSQRDQEAEAERKREEERRKAQEHLFVINIFGSVEEYKKSMIGKAGEALEGISRFVADKKENVDKKIEESAKEAEGFGGEIGKWAMDAGKKVANGAIYAGGNFVDGIGEMFRPSSVAEAATYTEATPEEISKGLAKNLPKEEEVEKEKKITKNQEELWSSVEEKELSKKDSKTLLSMMVPSGSDTSILTNELVAVNKVIYDRALPLDKAEKDYNSFKKELETKRKDNPNQITMEDLHRLMELRNQYKDVENQFLAKGESDLVEYVKKNNTTFYEKLGGVADKGYEIFSVLRPTISRAISLATGGLETQKKMIDARAASDDCLEFMIKEKSSELTPVEMLEASESYYTLHLAGRYIAEAGLGYVGKSIGNIKSVANGGSKILKEIGMPEGMYKIFGEVVGALGETFVGEIVTEGIDSPYIKDKMRNFAISQAKGNSLEKKMEQENGEYLKSQAESYEIQVKNWSDQKIEKELVKIQGNLPLPDDHKIYSREERLNLSYYGILYSEFYRRKEEQEKENQMWSQYHKNAKNYSGPPNWKAMDGPFPKNWPQ